MTNRLKELRQKNHLTLKQLGQELNMRDNTLSQYETGKRNPKLEIWKKLADYFDVSVPYLLGLKDEVDSQFVIKEYEKRNTQLIKELTALCNRYPGASEYLEWFENKNHIEHGFINTIKDEEKNDDETKN